jgi:hypothetical protein
MEILCICVRKLGGGGVVGWKVLNTAGYKLFNFISRICYPVTKMGTSKLTCSHNLFSASGQPEAYIMHFVCFCTEEE